ncbi:MAG: hypothetical protein V4636_03200 [Pseudomonadota bacterium]
MQRNPLHDEKLPERAMLVLIFTAAVLIYIFFGVSAFSMMKVASLADEADELLGRRVLKPRRVRAATRKMRFRLQRERISHFGHHHHA